MTLLFYRYFVGIGAKIDMIYTLEIVAKTLFLWNLTPSPLSTLNFSDDSHNSIIFHHVFVYITNKCIENSWHHRSLSSPTTILSEAELCTVYPKSSNFPLVSCVEVSKVRCGFDPPCQLYCSQNKVGPILPYYLKLRSFAYVYIDYCFLCCFGFLSSL